ncbi:MAG: hypothetical protein QXI16_06415, partial [Sulfolobaceae archaeon]
MNSDLEIEKISNNIYQLINQIKDIKHDIQSRLKNLAYILYKVRVERLYKQMGENVSWSEFCHEIDISPAYATKLVTIVSSK